MQLWVLYGLSHVGFLYFFNGYELVCCLAKESAKIFCAILVIICRGALLNCA
jgi:hypothetical protein